MLLHEFTQHTISSFEVERWSIFIFITTDVFIFTLLFSISMDLNVLSLFILSVDGVRCGEFRFAYSSVSHHFAGLASHGRMNHVFDFQIMVLVFVLP